MRSTVERANARLKDEFGALKVRVRGHMKVACHLMFGVLVLAAALYKGGDKKLERSMEELDREIQEAIAQHKLSVSAEVLPSKYRGRVPRDILVSAPYGTEGVNLTVSGRVGIEARLGY